MSNNLHTRGAAVSAGLGANGLLQRLRRRGWRLTAQRRVVAEALAGDHVHLTADQIFARAAARLPELSRATVYNTLNELVAMGELLEVNLDGTVRRYDPNTLAAHHHLVCGRCGAIRDVHPVNVAMLTMPKSESRGFSLNGVDIVFRGLCARCGTRSPSARLTPGRAVGG